MRKKICNEYIETSLELQLLSEQYKLLENELKKLKKQLHKFWQTENKIHPNNNFVITDANDHNKIIFVSPSFEIMTGYTADEIYGKNCKFLQGPKTCPESIQNISDGLKKGLVVRQIILNYTKDGVAFWNDLFIMPLYNESGQITGHMGVQKVISEQEALHKKKKFLIHSALDTLYLKYNQPLHDILSRTI